MPDFSIKGISKSTAEKLRARAARNHRSLQGELMAIVEAAANDEEGSLAASSSSRPAPVAELNQAPTMPRATRTIEQIAAELRALFAQPVDEVGPRSAELVREMRDAR